MTPWDVISKIQTVGNLYRTRALVSLTKDWKKKVKKRENENNKREAY